MEYAVPEATIGVKWEWVWNGIIPSDIQLITVFRNKLLVKFFYI